MTLDRELVNAHAKTSDDVLADLQTVVHGLSPHEAAQRLLRYGPNVLPREKEPGLFVVFLRQFISPLIYILLAAALLSLIIQEWSDAVFITAVLLINAIIGTAQEYSAQRAATALQKLVTTQCRVLRGGDTYEIDSEQLVPGDMVFFESGDRVAADVRLVKSNDLEIDESLLTGESVNVLKHADRVFESDTFLGDRRNMLFAGTLVGRGRGHGVVVATAMDTEIGHITASVISGKAAKPPLLIRMEIFTKRVALLVGLAAICLAAVALSQGTPITEILFLAVALAVSAIPEGLPVALTVALAIGMRRMAKDNVIIRRLIAVEALGSCTYIATDKTGTLTMNQLTVRRIVLANGDGWDVTGEGRVPDGEIVNANQHFSADELALQKRLCLSAVLPNDAFLGRRDGGWSSHGDAVDVALLVFAHKAGVIKTEIETDFPELAIIPFESERLFAASLNQVDDKHRVFVKGALERLLPMCNTMALPGHDVAIDNQAILEHSIYLAKQGYRILALADGGIELTPGQVFSDEHLSNLSLLGLLAMIDPLRKEASNAIATCREAGVQVAMVTGDHPVTALTIARELKLAQDEQQIVTGPQLGQARNDTELDALTRDACVFARVDPQQKLDIVHSLQRNGHFVAVSGDGANDAPALRAAHVGVAMGESGTDVARETASIVITDDNFASIIAGIREGRIAYANVRKVIFLLISTGVAELVLFTLALLTGLPLPLLAVQLLWLNLVTNGIQDVALAFEPGEGNELTHPPRAPNEPIFDRLMIERVIVSAIVIGSVAYLVFQWLLIRGFSLDEARNGTMLLMVLFENLHVFNSRSETRSIFTHNPLANPILLFGTAAAQLIHIGAMYTPWFSEVLHIQPVTFEHWLELLVFAFTVVVAMELHKLFRQFKKI